MNTSQKIALITGGSSGIGKETAIALADKGFKVYIVGRDPGKTDAAASEIRAKTGNNAVEYFIADLSDMDAIWKLSIAIHEKLPQLDVLVNNAGGVNQKREFTKQNIERTFATNHLSYFLLTNLLLELLKKSPSGRIVNVSSNSHYSGRIDFENLQGEKNYFIMKAYENSKLCNVLFTYELARRLEGTGVTANALHPGVVKTSIGNKNTAGYAGFLWSAISGLLGVNAAKGADTSVYLASSPEVEGVTGGYFVKRKSQKSLPVSYDTAIAKRLWDESCKLTGYK